MTTLRLILGDQLNPRHRWFAEVRPDVIYLLMEIRQETNYVLHHAQKVLAIFAAMRDFAWQLKEAGHRVRYITIDDASNRQSLPANLDALIAHYDATVLEYQHPDEWRLDRQLAEFAAAGAIPLRAVDSDHFYTARDEAAGIFAGRRQWLMEHFYRTLRQRHGVLLTADGKPEGGQWNFDHDNRKPLAKGAKIPERLRFEPDATTREVLQLVKARFGEHFGDLEPFGWAVTREDALRALEHFVHACLPAFGDTQDAMKAGEDFLHHAVISPYLNCGLLTAREVCDAAEDAWRAGRAPLNAVEGFIRQILGWREFVRGVYWSEMPGYAVGNHLDAHRDLPWFYWTGDTDLNCLRECIGTTRRTAYAHHIQRLMVTGNFALLAGVSPAQIEAWYLVVYADAFDWVELPNVHGMVMHADGGLLASKPYAASGAYIDRMSDYCAGCRFDPDVKLGPNACPFNYLYWNFLIVNEAKLSGNARMAMPYRTLAKMADERKAQIVAEATSFLEGLR
jgi:deoxyribodipyrimidine photolyase-related protein